MQNISAGLHTCCNFSTNNSISLQWSQHWRSSHCPKRNRRPHHRINYLCHANLIICKHFCLIGSLYFLSKQIYLIKASRPIWKTKLKILKNINLRPLFTNKPEVRIILLISSWSYSLKTQIDWYKDLNELSFSALWNERQKTTPSFLTSCKYWKVLLL